MKSDEAIKKQDFSDTLQRASIKDLGLILMGEGYEVRGITSLLSQALLYAFLRLLSISCNFYSVCFCSVGIYERSFIVCV